MDYDRLLNLTTDLGYQLMASGAEIYRVEESMHRVLNAYGLERPEVFAIPNCIIVSVTTPQGHPITRMRRIPGHGTDIELLERCNDGRRKSLFCTAVNLLELEDVEAVIARLEEEFGPEYPPEEQKDRGSRAAELVRERAQTRGVSLKLERQRKP